MTNLYSKTKIFHFKDKIDSLPGSVDKILPPVHIRIKPTNICNHSCKYCAYRATNLQLGCDMNETDFIPKEKMMEIVEDIIDMGVKAVTFSGGGEPLVYPHLAEVLKRLSDSPVRFAALTNGSLLKGDIAALFAHHAAWIRISMDGWDDESYSEYRRLPFGEFSKLLCNMEQFKKLGGACYLGVSLIVDEKNAKHIYELISKLKDVGVNSVKISPCIISNKGAKNNVYHKPLFKAVKEQIARSRNNIENDTFNIFDAYHELDAKFTKKYSWCPYCQILPVIGADQNIYFCQDKAYNLNKGLLGCIRDMKFKNFWFNNKDKFFTINPSIDCKHHCVSNQKNTFLFDYLSADKNHLAFV